MSLPVRMRTRFDRLAKQVLALVLDRFGTVVTEAEIVAIGQRADLFYRPGRDPPWDDQSLAGVIARMAAERALWEYFHEGLSLTEFERCLNKQRHWPADSEGPVGVAGQGRGGPFAFPRSKPWLWILTVRRPRKLLEEHRHSRPHDWPEGFYRIKGERVGVGVLGELPVTSETLILRLLGRREVQLEAMMKLIDWSRSTARPASDLVFGLLTVMWRHGDFMNQPARTKKEKSMLQEVLEWQENHDRQLREEGGKELLARLLEQKFGDLPASRRAQLDSADLDKLGAWQDRVLAAKGLDEVFGEGPAPTGRGGRSRRGGG